MADAEARIPQVRGCAWTRDAEPVFLLDRAHDVYEHALFWSEGEPASWFGLHVLRNDERYVVALAPNLSQSRARFLRRLELAGRRVAADAEWIYLFHPLVFVSTSPGTLASLKLARSTRVGLAVPHDAQAARPCIDWLGPLPVNPAGQDFSDYLRPLLADRQP
jgi:hypothetical protein